MEFAACDVAYFPDWSGPFLASGCHIGGQGECGRFDAEDARTELHGLPPATDCQFYLLVREAALGSDRHVDRGAGDGEHEVSQ